MDTLKQTLETEVRKYAGKGVNGHSYFMKSDTGDVMSVIASFQVQKQHYVDTSVLARIEDDRIVIEEDKTNKPLVDALMQAGIPRENIVLMYAGETVEETV